MFAKKQRILQYDQASARPPASVANAASRSSGSRTSRRNYFQVQFLGCIIHVTTLVNAFSAAHVNQHANAVGAGHQFALQASTSFRPDRRRILGIR